MAASLAIAAGTLGAAYLGKRANDNATKAQTKANDAALLHAKEQEALRRADYDRAYNDWLANRQALLARYGISIGQPVRGQGSQQRGTGSMPQAPPQPGQIYTIPFPGQTMPQRPAPQQRQPTSRPGSLADVMANRQAQAARVSDWNDWRMYGLPS